MRFQVIVKLFLFLTSVAFAQDPFVSWHQGQLFVFNADPTYSRQDYQWYICNTKQDSVLYLNGVQNKIDAGGTYDAEIDTLWNQPKYREVVVGLIDSGVDVNHPELREKFIKGIQFCTRGIFDPNDISDWSGHGTATAGVISSKANNVGLQGISESPFLIARTRLAVTSDGIGEIVSGIHWLVDNGAEIICLPWGTSVNDSSLKAACEYAGMKNVLIVAASPNTVVNLDISPDYPISFGLPNVVGVHNLDRLGNIYNSGTGGLTIGAPGRIIVTAARGNGYCYTSGTSLSAAVTTGVAALIKSRINGPVNAAELARTLKLGSRLDAFNSYLNTQVSDPPPPPPRPLPPRNLLRII